jgi:hypothetical protein
MDKTSIMNGAFPSSRPHPSSLAAWDPDFLSRSPMFEPLRSQAGAFGAEWPRLAELQRLLDARDSPVCNAAGMPLRLVPQGRRRRVLEEKHEARTFLAGELQVRERNWHDLFNLLAWLAFPRAKAALNARHYSALAAQRAAGTANRGPAQDALTLFDEGGVVVASDDDELLGLLREWRWKELFWSKRPRLIARMRFHVFGHALYEKALCPFNGITGRGIVLKTDQELLKSPLPEQLAGLDSRIAAYFADPGNLRATRELAVVPVLGVPGWCVDNEREVFYDDLDYFRPGRRTEQSES